MLANQTDYPYKNITRATILDAKKIYYPLRFAMQKRDVQFDPGLPGVLEVALLPEDVNYPADIKDSDAGPLLAYKVNFTINNQAGFTQEQLEPWQGKKVIMLLHYPEGRIIIGCNEMPLRLFWSDQNDANPSKTNGFYIECAGNALVPKVIR